MLSRMNDKFYGQWLVLHVPFVKLSDFLLPVDMLGRIPVQYKYFTMALRRTHPVARRMLLLRAVGNIQFV
jgi:hypothetical protein